MAMSLLALVTIASTSAECSVHMGRHNYIYIYIIYSQIHTGLKQM